MKELNLSLFYIVLKYISPFPLKGMSLQCGQLKTQFFDCSVVKMLVPALWS